MNNLPRRRATWLNTEIYLRCEKAPIFIYLSYTIEGQTLPLSCTVWCRLIGLLPLPWQWIRGKDARPGRRTRGRQHSRTVPCALSEANFHPKSLTNDQVEIKWNPSCYLKNISTVEEIQHGEADRRVKNLKDNNLMTGIITSFTIRTSFSTNIITFLSRSQKAGLIRATFARGESTTEFLALWSSTWLARKSVITCNRSKLDLFTIHVFDMDSNTFEEAYLVH